MDTTSRGSRAKARNYSGSSPSVRLLEAVQLGLMPPEYVGTIIGSDQDDVMVKLAELERVQVADYD